jgi:phosphoglycolate phosphatase
VKLLVTDLDNTLYDWVTFFAHAFYKMVDVAVPLLGVPKEDLLDQLREVHRRHHNSEHPFALLETAAVQQKMPALTRSERAQQLDEAFHAFNSARQQSLRPYPGVLDTLRALRSQGVRIVAHTEATVTNAQFRLSKLGLSPLIERLYAVQHTGDDHPVPERQEQLTAVPHVRHLRQDERKPDPQVLLDICSDTGIPPKLTVYVGDSISRDIGMAKAAGVWAVWARYGTHFDASAWDALVRITHWTEEDVRRANEAKARFGDAEPDVVLDQFSELPMQFDFLAAGGSA